MIKILIYSYFFYLFFSQPIHAMAPISLDWLEAQNRQVFAELLANEPPLLIPEDPQDEAMFGPARDFGDNWMGINHLQLACLKDIYRTYQAGDRERVSAIDIGAGPGAMTWKMIAVGARVFGVTKSREMAQLVHSSVQTHAVPLLGLEEIPLKTIVLDFHRVPEILNHKYDIAWSAQNLQNYHPAQVEAYLEKLYKVLKPGGRAYLTTLTPSYDQEELAAFKRALDRRESFPGYFVKNQVVVTKKKLLEGEPQVYKLFMLNLLGLHHQEQLLPRFRFLGFYGEPELNPQLKMIMSPKNHRENFVAFHSAIHKFDAATLERLFSKAGFTINDLFYFDLSGHHPKIPAHQFTDELRNSTRWGLAIKVTKPFEEDGKHDEND